MWFLNYIIERLDSVTGFFLDAYQEVKGWIWPFRLLSTPLYWLYYSFFYITYRFGQFNEWLTWAAGRIDDILSTWDIWSYFRTWFDYAIDAWDWVRNSFWNVWNIIGDWWSSVQYIVLTWIADATSWAAGQLNSLRDLILNIWSDIEAWTITQWNNLQATFAGLISSVESWTLTQIESVKSAILAIIGDVSTWTMAQINTIQNTLTTLIDWTALTNWITSWWNMKLFDVDGLIGSKLAEWFPFYNDVAEFFSNPGEFLLSKLTDWFLGPED